ncbi:reprolysin-like metallopeptidase [Pseudomonas sp. EMN2]|uniref:reprolysin-like metallopeptidase n=1 Tax=Pseudomonas sp. EMN2 TaxID=2615212 RepID=UPI00129AF96A|nr:zinc-dependent metalloprotease family protein [Pseudomonas sp. EMN2]
MRKLFSLIIPAGTALLLSTACSATPPPAVSIASATPQLFMLEPTPDRDTLKRSADGHLARVLADPASQEVTFIKLSSALVNGQTHDLAVTMPNGKTAQFHLRDFSTITAGIEGWVGYKPSNWKSAHASSSAAEIDIDPLYYLSLAREGDTVVGSVIVDGQRYRIDDLGAGKQVLIKVDESQLPQDAEPLQANMAGSVDDTPGKVHGSAHSVLRVLFLVTNQRKAATPTYKLVLANALNDANQYMINSNVGVTYELAGFYEGEYDETGRSYTQQLNDIRLAQPFAGEVLKRREALGAHLVSMYSTARQNCGMAWLTASKAQAHSVISCPASLAHELGHNLGVSHGWTEGDAQRKPPYMHGYRHNTAPTFRTIMTGTAGAIPFFSNPRLQYQGVPMGTTNHHDAARRFNERRETVENFYPPAMEFTLYEHENYEGRSCTIVNVGSKSSSVLANCGPGWNDMVSSVKIRGFVPGARATLESGGETLIWSKGNAGYTGELNIPSMDKAPILPPGMERIWAGPANDRLRFVGSSFMGH